MNKTKERVLAWLKENGITPHKVIFKNESPFQAARYNVVGWEAWVYKSSGDMGVLITEEDFMFDASRRMIIERLL